MTFLIHLRRLLTAPTNTSLPHFIMLFAAIGLIAASMTLTSCSKQEEAAQEAVTEAKTEVVKTKIEYPVARKADVVEDYHGTQVADPYRWLEDPDADETVAWVSKQNEAFFDYIDTPERKMLEERLTQLWNYPKYSLPYKRGDRYFFSKNDGLQNQSVFYVQETLDAEPAVVLDPNTLSEDGTVSLRSQALTEDGKIFAYGLSSSGSDWQEIHIKEVDSGKSYDDLLKWTKFTSIAWKHDNSGFYYNRFPDPSTLPDEDHTKYNQVYWHKLGTFQSDDVHVYGSEEEKDLGFYPGITDDGKYLYLYVYLGTDDRNGIYFRTVDSEGEFTKLMEVGEAEYGPIDNIDNIVYMRTNYNAPKRRIIAVDINNPAKENWKEIIPEADDVIDFASMVNDHLIVAYMQDAHHILKIFDKEGKFVREIELPTIGSVGGLSGRREDTEMFFGFTSFVYPYTAFRYDFKKDEVVLFRKPKVDFDANLYETKQVFCPSKDGTKIPVFITHKKGLQLDGNNPTVLYAYGGFNVSLTPYFSISRLAWLDAGGVYAVANLRGGAEYGEEWHQAGMLENKQNVFDDFIGCSEWLIDGKYTSTEKLAIMGGSNGGLLTCACLLQRPDLFGAVVSQVPVTDMLRYHKFTVGRYWVPEYGNAEENPEHFQFLYTYSPLHNVPDGIKSPPTMVTSADTDDRVVPLHAKKFVATLQEKDAGHNPILLRVETKAGHGGGKPTSKRIEEAADTYAFLMKTFGMKM
jgi:prolyl oligopeptidase